MSVFDDPDIKKLLKSFELDGLPKIDESAFVMLIDARPLPEMCLQVGAAVLLDKPLILAIPKGQHIPANLKRIATSIIEMDMGDKKGSRERIAAAIRQLMENNNRIPRKKGA